MILLSTPGYGAAGNTPPQIQLADPINEDCFLLADFYAREIATTRNPFDGRYPGTNTSINAGDFVDSPAGLAVDFDGANDEIVYSNSLRSSVGDQLSMSMWINADSMLQGTFPIGFCHLTSAAYDAGIYQFTGANNYGYYIRNDSGTAVYAATTSAPGAGAWFHIAGTYDGATVKIYVNGVLEGSNAQTGDVDNWGSSYPPQIGAGWFNKEFDGKIGLVRMARRGWTAGEVARLFREPRAGLVPPRWLPVEAAAAGGGSSALPHDTLNLSSMRMGL